MNVLVIDDDLCFLNAFKEQIIVSFDDVECDLYTSMPDVTTLKEEYDVIVIDLLLKDDSGIKVGEELKKIYVSAYYVFTSHKDQLVFDTMHIQPLYFIRKREFNHDYSIMIKLLKEKLNKRKKLILNHINIKNHELLFVECSGHYLYIHTIKNNYRIRMTMNEFIDLTKDWTNIVQVHKSYIVNMDYINEINKDCVYILNDSMNNRIPLARRKRKNFICRYEKYLLEK